LLQSAGIFKTPHGQLKAVEDWPKLTTTLNVHILLRQSIANLHGRI
jgi:hypothetical protein